MSRARDRWLEEGIEVLAEHGPDGIRIDRIAARLGLSKGSFHHHFNGAAGYKRDLLNHLAHMQTSIFDDAVAASGFEAGTTPQDTLLQMTALLDRGQGMYRPRLEAALRAWALTDHDAALTQAMIDESRLHTLRTIWRRISDDEELVRLAALLPYVIALGASVLQPPLEASDLQGLYRSIVPLVPVEAPSPTDELSQP